MTNQNDLLTQAIAPLVDEAVAQKFNKQDIDAVVLKQLKEVVEQNTKLVKIELEGKEESKPQLVHKQFDELLQVVAVGGLNVLLTGGAGNAKSTAVTQVATALQLEFASISFSNQTTKSDLLGFVDAQGVYRKSAFIDAFETGKVFLADEMDACSSNVLVLLNSAISNGFIQTPENKIVKAHANFRFVATANTNLRGAKNGYTARNKLDAATVDRFVVIEWHLDEELEKIITDNEGWLEIVRHCRKTAENSLENFSVTPRSSYTGAKLLKAGMDVDKVIAMTITRAAGVDEEKVLTKGLTAVMKNKALKGAK